MNGFSTLIAHTDRELLQRVGMGMAVQYPDAEFKVRENPMYPQMGYQWHLTWRRTARMNPLTYQQHDIMHAQAAAMKTFAVVHDAKPIAFNVMRCDACGEKAECVIVEKWADGYDNLAYLCRVHAHEVRKVYVRP